MKKCDCWHEAYTKRKSIGVCYGTKECDQCDCGGDEAKCDFYPEKRKVAMKPECGKWISVKERLPEMYEDGSADIVLVTDGQFVHMAGWAHGNWYFAECGEMKEPMFYAVTHWMPLPEPPKEG